QRRATVETLAVVRQVAGDQPVQRGVVAQAAGGERVEALDAPGAERTYRGAQRRSLDVARGGDAVGDEQNARVAATLRRQLRVEPAERAGEVGGAERPPREQPLHLGVTEAAGGAFE